MPVGSKFATTAPVFTFTATGSTTVIDLAPYSKDFKINQTMKSADGTGYGNANTQYFKTISDLSISWSTFLETGNVIEDALVPGSAGTIIFGPGGSTTGLRKYTQLGFVSDFSPTYPYSDMAMADTTFMPSATLTRGVYP